MCERTHWFTVSVKKTHNDNSSLLYFSYIWYSYASKTIESILIKPKFFWTKHRRKEASDRELPPKSYFYFVSLPISQLLTLMLWPSDVLTLRERVQSEVGCALTKRRRDQRGGNAPNVLRPELRHVGLCHGPHQHSGTSAHSSASPRTDASSETCSCTLLLFLNLGICILFCVFLFDETS